MHLYQMLIHYHILIKMSRLKSKNEEKIKPNKVLLCLGGIIGAFGGLTFLINIGDGIEEAMLPLIILIVGGILLMLAFKKNITFFYDF